MDHAPVPPKNWAPAFKPPTKGYAKAGMDVMQPDPDEVDKSAMEWLVDRGEDVEEISQAASMATSGISKVAQVVGKTAPAAVGRVASFTGKANPLIQAALTTTDTARMLGSPGYREAVGREGERAANASTKDQLLTTAGMVFSRPAATGKYFWSAMGAADTRNANEQLKLQSAQRRARDLDRRLKNEQLLRSGALTPRMDRLTR